ncbi:MAG TPA: iron-sulfur cluster assembly accessory protein [Puia sp.]|nr:iron-sulfur cluster assembly accessory protein [Puia sp.]
MITMTAKAKNYIGRMKEEEGRPANAFLRVGVKAGGCSGLEYQMNFDSLLADGDQVFEDEGVKIVVDLKSLLYLYGTELDYSDGLNGKGLYFNNPNASRTCSCGESFAV